MLGGAVAAAALVLPSTALADCATAIDKTAFNGSVAQYYPQACYSAALKKLGPDVKTYSPNVVRNVKTAMNRDRRRTVKVTYKWTSKTKVRVTANVKLKSTIQLRKGAKVIGKGSISSKTALLKAKRTRGKFRVALIWTLGKKKITVTRPATVAKAVKKKAAKKTATAKKTAKKS
jgi:hypothetical protein